MSTNQYLFLDYETYSLADLEEVGLDNYIKHPSTGISMLGWALDREDIEIWLPHLGPPPQKLLDAMRNPAIVKIAWHASFEHGITKYPGAKHGLPYIPISQYRDPMILAHNLSLPGKLSKVGAILNMKEQKDPRGEELVQMFCVPVSMGGEKTLFGITPPLFRDHNTHPREFAEYVEYCFTPQHTLLGEDLIWRAASQFKIGDVVLGFDETGPNRFFKRSIIEKISFATEPVFDVELSSGKHFYVTAGHKWLVSRYRRNDGGSQSLHWVDTAHLLTRFDRKNASCSRVPRLMPTWTRDASRDAGWLAGIFDGEANISRHRFVCGGRSFNGVFVAQNPGATLDKIKTETHRLGFSFKEHCHNQCRKISILGGKYEGLRFLGTIGPHRLIEKINFDELGRLECRSDSETIKTITPVGPKEIIQIQTNTGTLVVDGYPMHNCKQDVRAERDLWYRMKKVGFPEQDWQLWLLDQKINMYGIPTRRDLAEKGLRLSYKFIKIRRDLLKEKTGLANPNSDTQMKEWVSARGYKWKSLRAPTVKAELKNSASTITPECREALTLRASARKSSYTKIEKLLAILSDDDRLRYQLRYMGAARTGRWASGGGEDASVQVQNFSRGEKAVKKKLMHALDLLEREDYDAIEAEFTNTKDPKDAVTVVEFVITLLRSLFQAKPGKKFLVGDKNAIENRMLGWVAGCAAILDVFRHSKEDGGDPYLAFGSKLYNKPYAEMWAAYKAGNEEERTNSKPPVLGAGYGLGGGEMYTNEYGDEVRGGLWGYALTVCDVDMPKELAHKGVKIFREAYLEVVQLWTDLEEAFKQVLTYGGVIKVGEVTWNKQEHEWLEHPTKGKQCVITFRRITMGDGQFTMRMELPSGRALHYLNATIDEENMISKKTGKPYISHTIHYDGVEHSATQGADGKNAKKTHKWGRVKTYGGKLTENAVQALSRDDLGYSMMLADEMGMDLWGLFHDEIAAEVDDVWDGFRLEDLIYCMTQVPPWAPGLLLGAEGYESKVYKKG